MHIINNVKSFVSSHALIYLFFYITLTGFSFGGFVDGIRYKGTNIGVQQCIDKNGPMPTESNLNAVQQIQTHFVVRKKCIEKHEKSSKQRDWIGGKAGFIYPQWRHKKNSFDVDITNKSKDKVITFLEIRIKHSDNTLGEELVQRAALLVLPENTKNIKFEELKFFPEKDRISNQKSELWTWNITKVKYIDFVLK
jgi:hypothetical protein